MSDPKASQIYASLDAHVPPATIADDHLQAKLAGDASLALALECHMRDLARVWCHVEEVRQALAKVERHTGLRKPGTGAPKMLQEIADAIAADYAAGDYARMADGRIRFDIGKLRVTCEDLPGAVALVCAKYRRGLPKSR